MFAKLSDWGLPAVVIPHGLSWGTTNPAHAKLDNQIAQHDSVFQPLLEVYSGHGNSEVFRDFRLPEMKADASYDCPADGEDMETHVTVMDREYREQLLKSREELER